MEMDGLVITKAVYGNSRALKRRNGSDEVNNDVASQVSDVALPLNFLVDDSGTLKVWSYKTTTIQAIYIYFAIFVNFDPVGLG